MAILPIDPAWNIVGVPDDSRFASLPTKRANSMFSLWRGDVLLGRINPELPGEGDDALFGVLDPSAAFLPGEAISQHTMLDVPGTPVFQHVENRAAGPAPVNPQVMSSGARPLSDVMRDSVPIEQQLELRDDTNGHVATSMIAIMAMPSAGGSILQRCQDAGVVFSGWLVIAGLVRPASGAR